MRTRGEVTRQDEMSRETDALPSNKNKKVYHLDDLTTTIHIFIMT